MTKQNAISILMKNGKKGTKAYNLIMQALLSGSNTIRPCTVQGCGRRTKNADYTAAVKWLLDKCRIRYSFTNNAPRGGLTGNLIVLTHIVNN